LDAFAQPGGGHTSGRGLQGQVCPEYAVAAARFGPKDSGALHLRLALQNALDIGQIDPKPVQLDLAVFSSEDLNPAIGKTSSEVPAR